MWSGPLAAGCACRNPGNGRPARIGRTRRTRKRCGHGAPREATFRPQATYPQRHGRPVAGSPSGWKRWCGLRARWPGLLLSRGSANSAVEQISLEHDPRQHAADRRRRPRGRGRRPQDRDRDEDRARWARAGHSASSPRWTSGDDCFLFGHDGPAHIALSEAASPSRELKVFHGKAGGGLSVEMRPSIGPVTVLGLTHGREAD